MVVSCAICLDTSINEVVTACEESDDHTLCRDCAVSYICDKINSSFLGSCPAIVCPYPHANKQSRILRYDAWKSIVALEETTKYDSLAKSVLAIICGHCHRMGSLQMSPSSDQIEEASKFFGDTSAAHDEDFLARLATYESGMLSTEEIYDDLSMQFFGDQLSSSYKKDTWNIVFHALALVSNPERRLTLHLRHLRDNPLFWTPCCNAVHCFRCRTKGEHESQSCEDNMSKLDHDIVTCPSCAVSIVKGDGCDSVACVCGKYLSWSTEKVNRRYREEFLAAFPTNTTAACARLLLDTMSDDQGASEMLSHARMWQAHNVVAVNKEFLQAWAARFSGYKAQACLVLASGAGAAPFNLSAGYHEAGRLWRSQHSAEVDKCIAANTVAVRDLFPSQFPEGPERVLAAATILGSNRAPSFLLGGYESYRCDERMVSSATEWRSRHQQEYEECVDALESRLALQFLYLHGQATPSQTITLATVGHVPFVAVFLTKISPKKIKFSGNRSTVIRRRSSSLKVAHRVAFASLPADRCMFSIILEELLQDGENHLSVGLVTKCVVATPAYREYNDNIGRFPGSWGLDCATPESTDVCSEGVVAASCRTLKKGDRLTAIVDTAEGWLELIVNRAEFRHRVAIPSGLSKEDYYFAVTLPINCSASIVRSGSTNGLSARLKLSLNVEHGEMLERLTAYLKGILEDRRWASSASMSAVFKSLGEQWREGYPSTEAAARSFLEMVPLLRSLTKTRFVLKDVGCVATNPAVIWASATPESVPASTFAVASSTDTVTDTASAPATVSISVAPVTLLEPCWNDLCGAACWYSTTWKEVATVSILDKTSIMDDLKDSMGLFDSNQDY